LALYRSRVRSSDVLGDLRFWSCGVRPELYRARLTMPVLIKP